MEYKKAKLDSCVIPVLHSFDLDTIAMYINPTAFGCTMSKRKIEEHAMASALYINVYLTFKLDSTNENKK